MNAVVKMHYKTDVKLVTNEFLRLEILIKD